MLGFDSEGRGLWDDSSYFEGDFSSAYEDVYQERVDLQYLEFLRDAGLPYYGTGVAPHDPVPHRDAYKAWSLATYLRSKAVRVRVLGRGAARRRLSALSERERATERDETAAPSHARDRRSRTGPGLVTANT